MGKTVLIFGKDGCPYTKRAREDYEKNKVSVEYFDVTRSAEDMKKMLEYSKGEKRVPVIVEDGSVTIGYGGGT